MAESRSYPNSARDHISEVHALAEQATQLAFAVKDHILARPMDVLELDAGVLASCARGDLRQADTLLSLLADLTERMHDHLEAIDLKGSMHPSAEAAVA